MSLTSNVFTLGLEKHVKSVVPGLATITKSATISPTILGRTIIKPHPSLSNKTDQMQAFLYSPRPGVEGGDVPPAGIVSHLAKAYCFLGTIALPQTVRDRIGYSVHVFTCIASNPISDWVLVGQCLDGLVDLVAKAAHYNLRDDDKANMQLLLGILNYDIRLHAFQQKNIVQQYYDAGYFAINNGYYFLMVCADIFLETQAPAVGTQ